MDFPKPCAGARSGSYFCYLSSWCLVVVVAVSKCCESLRGGVGRLRWLELARSKRASRSYVDGLISGWNRVVVY